MRGAKRTAGRGPECLLPFPPLLCLSVSVFDPREQLTPVGAPAPPSPLLAPRPPQDTEVPLAPDTPCAPPPVRLPRSHLGLQHDQLSHTHTHTLPQTSM